MKPPQPVYVQYGCGLSCPTGWLNFDASPTLRLQALPIIGGLFRRGVTVFPEGVLYGDIVRGLPVTDGSAQGVYASHVLEHLSYADFWMALQHTFRMLRPGGIFRLVVPDLQVRAKKYIEEVERGHAEANSRFMRAAHLGLEHRPRGVSAIIRSTLGNSAHLWMWDELSMSAALRKTGFTDIRRCGIGDCKDDAFRRIEDAGRFYDSDVGVEECAMEAIKPAAEFSG